MIIAYIMRFWPEYGGGETITAILANEFVKRGHTIHVLYHYWNSITPMPYELDSRIKEKQLNTSNYTENNVNALGAYLRENKIDVMINQWGDQRLCFEAKKLSGAKLVTCWHMNLFQERKPIAIKSKFYCLLAGRHNYQKRSIKFQVKEHLEREHMSDHYVFLSKSYENEYLRFAKGKSDATKLDSIPNALTYSFDYDINHYNEKKKEVLFVGRMIEYHKRLSYILKIWKQIEADAQLIEWNLRIVGDGPDLQATINLCHELKLQRVFFEGFKDPQPFYEQASIFMMTSALEGFPMVLGEAQQYAVVPVVMDSFSSLHDIITNGENGVIVENNDINGFVYAMKELMNNNNYRKCIAQRCLFSSKRYTVDKIVDKWEVLFKTLFSISDSIKFEHI